MNHEEARGLAHLIIDTWPAFVIKAHVWCEALAELDHAEAVETYEYLRDHDEKPPSVARFLALHARTRTDEHSEPAELDIDPSISLDEYLRRHPDDVDLVAARDRHPARSPVR